jgi:hypothetical protein
MDALPPIVVERAYRPKMAKVQGAKADGSENKPTDGRDRDAVNRFAAQHSQLFSEALEHYQMALLRKPSNLNETEANRTRRIEESALRQFSGEIVPPAPLVVREYAAPRPAPAGDADFELSDTVLWQPVIVLPADGKATLTFALGAAPGGYEVLVAGHTPDGRLGAERRLVRVAPGAPPAPVPPPVPVPPPAQPAP